MSANSLKYQHFTLNKKNILTLCSSLDRENLILTLGFTVFNKNDKRYTKKEGNAIAKQRMIDYPIFLDISTDEFVFHEFLSWVSLERIHFDMIKIKTYGLSFSDDVIDSVGNLAEIFQDYTIAVLEEQIEEVICDVGDSMRALCFH